MARASRSVVLKLVDQRFLILVLLFSSSARGCPSWFSLLAVGNNMKSSVTTATNAAAAAAAATGGVDHTDDGEEDHNMNIVLPVRQYGYRSTKLGWADLVTIIQMEQNFAKLSRSKEQQRQYEIARRHIQRQWKSIYDSILYSKFVGFEKRNVTLRNENCSSAKEEDSSSNNNNNLQQQQVWEVHPPLSECTLPQTSLVINDFPYYTERGIVHYILWKTLEDVTEAEIQSAHSQLQERLQCKEILYFTNPPHLKSLPGIDHVHFFCRLLQ
jgi:hypothetical protein